MNYNMPMIFIVLMAITVFITAANLRPTEKYKNLKVLPVDISEHKLDSIMNSYNVALKVSCDFCHVRTKNMFSFTSANSDTLDFAADGDRKENARRMIRMMIDINRNYFYYDKDVRPEYLNAVSCNTCHRGNPFPLDQ